MAELAEKLNLDASVFNRLKQVATAAIVIVVLYIVGQKALEMDWREVADAVAGYAISDILLGFAIILPAYAAVSAYDLIGRRATGHDIPIWRTSLISFTGYFLSLNLGALLGGIAIRYRLYATHKLSAMTIGQIIGLTVTTNWLGFLLLAGGVLIYQPPELPEEWGLGTGLLRTLGGLSLATVVAYLLACFLKAGKKIEHERGVFEVPTLATAFLQLALSCISWGAIAFLISRLLPGEASWLIVMPALMVSAVAGIWSHIPGGLGVTETVFVTLLSSSMAEAEILAGIIVFRAIYYLVPFVLASIGYLVLELTKKS